MPYHKKILNYIEKRNEIFKISSIQSPGKKSKRSTIRLREYFKRRKLTSKLIISSIINDRVDKRYYASVKFLNFCELGLLDTGANVTCIGSDLAKLDFSEYEQYSVLNTKVKTADGSLQKVLGYLLVDVMFKSQTEKMKIFVVPSLNQRLILGLDFWIQFKLAPNLFGNVVYSTPNEKPSELSEQSALYSINKPNTSSYEYPLSESELQQLSTIKELFPNFEKQGLGRTSLIQHKIDIGSSEPVKQRYYPVSPAVEKLMYQEIDRMLSLGVIEPSSSPWSSPMRLVVKPNKVRLCLDARRLNQVTKKDAYPLPSIEGIFSRLPKAHLISKLDLKDAYWQIGLTAESKPLTAFTIPGRPLYQFTVMPFGLCNAPSTMCRLVDEIIPPDLRGSVFGYLDDLIIVSEDFSTHLSILVRLSQQFKKANLTLNVAKSQFCVTEVNYLGYIIGNGGIKTDPDKINSILNWPSPKNIKQVRGFLGLAGWYRRFIANFSTIVWPITEVLSTKRKFVWTSEAQTSFDEIKRLLTSAPVLTNPDFSKKFYLHCDASDVGIGAVLIQMDEDGNEKPIAYMSKKLNSAQRNYSVTERECLAAIEAVKKFRCYLELQEFEIITDHSSLTWLMKQPDLTGRLARWVLKLQGYIFTISHRKGKEHIVPDALSRIPVDEVAGIELTSPEIDLDSIHFSDDDYQTLRRKICESPSSYPDVKIVDKFVYIRVNHYQGDVEQESSCWKLWVPFKLRDSVIKRAHDLPISCHGGIVKTLELIRRHFFWPGLVRDVRQYIKSCETCKTTKAPNCVLRPEMGQVVVTDRPFQRLYVDLLGPYPRSKKGHIGLLIVLDHLSKFHWLCPLRNFTSKAIMEFLRNNIFHIYGVPEVVVSDNGSQFKAHDFNAFLTSFGIRHIYTALYSPQANASERVNRSIISGIRAYLKEEHNLWDQHLSSISCSLRNSYHQSIKTSPYRAVFGLEMITHGSSYELLRKLKILDEPTQSINREDELQLLRKDLKKNISMAYETNRSQYNLRSKKNSYVEGQEIFRRNFAQSNQEKKFSAKLAPLFLKAKIKNKIGNNYYLLEDFSGKEIGTYHAKDLRL